jgi:hypothetical protein
METYIVRVNGEEFEVEIEKADGSAAPAAPATEDKPRQKTRQEIYQDIAAKYV